MKKYLITLAIAGMVGIMGLTGCDVDDTQVEQSGAANTDGGQDLSTPPETNDTEDATDNTTDATDTSEETNDIAENATDTSEEADTPEAIQLFGNFKGTIIEVNPKSGDDNAFIVNVEGEVLSDGSVPLANFVVNENSVILAELEAGTEIIGFFDNLEPITRIYPPQYRAVAIAPIYGVMVDRFDENFLSSDGSIYINLEETEIVLQDGTVFDGEISELANRAMVVMYDLIMQTYPAQTNPTKVVVLFENAVHPIYTFEDEQDGFMDIADWQGGYQLSQEELEEFWSSLIDEENVQVIVNGEAVEMPTPYVNRDAGMVMLPVAYVAEALGYNVVGEGADVVVGMGTTFTVGTDSYFFGRMSPVQLGAAPELHDDVLYVPMHFFGEVFPDSVWLADGNVVITSANPE